MADVAETVKEAQPVEKEVVEKAEKKVIDLEEEEEKPNGDTSEEVKENGDAEKNGDSKPETNGTNGVSTEGSAKRKSGATDAADGAVEGTPEKKAKVVEPESEESNSTNGSTEVTA